MSARSQVALALCALLSTVGSAQARNICHNRQSLAEVDDAVYKAIGMHISKWTAGIDPYAGAPDGPAVVCWASVPLVGRQVIYRVVPKPDQTFTTELIDFN